MLKDPAIYRKIEKVKGLLDNPRIQGYERRELYFELYCLKISANPVGISDSEIDILRGKIQ